MVRNQVDIRVKAASASNHLSSQRNLELMVLCCNDPNQCEAGISTRLYGGSFVSRPAVAAPTPLTGWLKHRQSCCVYKRSFPMPKLHYGPAPCVLDRFARP